MKKKNFSISPEKLNVLQARAVVRTCLWLVHHLKMLILNAELGGQKISMRASNSSLFCFCRQVQSIECGLVIDTFFKWLYIPKKSDWLIIWSRFDFLCLRYSAFICFSHKWLLVEHFSPMTLHRFKIVCCKYTFPRTHVYLWNSVSTNTSVRFS